VDIDDPTVEDSWRLLRRIPVETLVWSANEGAWILTSMAFQGHKTNRRAFSVHLEPVLFENGLSHESVLQDPSRFYLAAFTAAQARSQRQVVKRDPLPGDPAHAHLIGDKTGAVQKHFKRCAVWVVAPTNLPPPA
jgi:hypothetical protein